MERELLYTANTSTACYLTDAHGQAAFKHIEQHTEKLSVYMLPPSGETLNPLWTAKGANVKWAQRFTFQVTLASHNATH